MKRLFLLFILLLCGIGIVSAIPNTDIATLIGSNNVTMNGDSVSGTVGWFQWGLATGQVWAHTPNVTPAGGIISYTMTGTPIFGNTTYYYEACDVTGCGLQVSFLTMPVTPLPTTTFGQYAENITQNGFSPANIVYNSVQPYIAVSTATIFYAIILMMLFVGLWLRTRGTATAQQIGMICAILFVSSAVGLGLGIPPEFAAAAQALLYVSLASTILMFTFK